MIKSKITISSLESTLSIYISIHTWMIKEKSVSIQRNVNARTVG